MSATTKEDRLQELIAELDAIKNQDQWDTVEAWAAKAKPFIRQAYPDHLADFTEVTKTPRWVSSPISVSWGGSQWDDGRHGHVPDFSSARETEDSDRRDNQRIAVAAKNKILGLLRGLLQLPAQSVGTEQISTGIRLFISHSAKDRELAALLIACINDCVQVPDRAIRCTSVPGYKLDPGENAVEALRRNLAACTLVIGLVTEESLRSNFVIMELGAAWGFKKRTCAVLTPGVGFGRIPSPISQDHAVLIDNQSDMAQLMEVVSEDLELPMHNAGRVNAAVQKLVETVKATMAAKEAAADGSATK